MHDPGGMRRAERVRDLPEHDERPRTRERARAPQLARQRRPVEELHDDVERPGRRVLARVHHLRDVIACDGGRQSRLQHEATAELVVRRELAVHRLEGTRAPVAICSTS